MANPCAKCYFAIFCRRGMSDRECPPCAKKLLRENGKLRRAIRWYHNSGEPLTVMYPEARTINAVCFPKSKVKL